MKCILQLTAAAAFAVNSVTGHYIFQHFSAGGTHFPNGPATDLASIDLRCNVGGGVSNGTEIITMNAGDEFTFTLDTAVYHAGPLSLYMSKAPGAAADYDGKWPLVQDPRLGSVWLELSFEQCIPNGEYLLLIQQLALHNPGAPPQSRSSTAETPTTCDDLGFIKSTDPGQNINIYNSNLQNYVVPGPRVSTQFFG
ncbi:hypothetical protein VTK56DRAFT_4282 [Thermocarpiscus australiensis]